MSRASPSLPPRSSPPPFLSGPPRTVRRSRRRFSSSPCSAARRNRGSTAKRSPASSLRPVSRRPIPNVACSDDGLCMTTTGMGYANAASSIAALVFGGAVRSDEDLLPHLGHRRRRSGRGHARLRPLGALRRRRRTAERDRPARGAGRLEHGLSRDWRAGAGQEGRGALRRRSLSPERGPAAGGLPPDQGRRSRRQRRRQGLSGEICRTRGDRAAAGFDLRHDLLRHLVARRAPRRGDGGLRQARHRRRGQSVHDPTGGQRDLDGA